jgi:type I restriction enzyme R subunit
VLDKNISSMPSFKQIIGRATRIDEEHNKYYFTIMDFKKATELFRDPDFDGEPVSIYEPNDGDDPVPPDPENPDDDAEDDDDDNSGSTKVYVKGVAVKIISERVEYIGPDGDLITESYRDYSRKQIQSEFESLDDFLKHWGKAKKKKAIVDLFEEHGVIFDNLAQDIYKGGKGKEYGVFDMICHIAYDQPPLTRKERVNNVKKRNYFTHYGKQARAVLEALLDKYADEGISTLESNKVLQLQPFTEMGAPMEIVKNAFGSKAAYVQAIENLEQELFKQDEAS